MTNAARTLLHYHHVINVNQKRSELLKGNIDPSLAHLLPSNWPGIAMLSLPKSLDSQGHVTVKLVK